MDQNGSIEPPAAIMIFLAPGCFGIKDVMSYTPFLYVTQTLSEAAPSCFATYKYRYKIEVGIYGFSV